MKLLPLLTLLTPALALVIPRAAPRIVLPGTKVAPGNDLRILALGASITAGWKSSDGNGFRQKLQGDLTYNRVRFAGVNRNGNMEDNWHAGYPGYTIDETAAVAGPSLAQQPNVVLIHSGTNDLTPGIATQPYEEAPQRLGNLIDQVHAASPDAVVLVAQIIHPADPEQDVRTQAYNDAIPAVVQQRQALGWKVAVVDFRSITSDQLVDNVHPNDAAYHAMGDIWYDALHALPEWWITQPVGADPHPFDPLPTISGS